MVEKFEVMAKFKILVPCFKSLSDSDKEHIECAKDHYRKMYAPEEIDFEIVERSVPNRKIKEPKRNFVNKFNKNNHRK